MAGKRDIKSQQSAQTKPAKPVYKPEAMRVDVLIRADLDAEQVADVLYHAAELGIKSRLHDPRLAVMEVVERFIERFGLEEVKVATHRWSGLRVR